MPNSKLLYYGFLLAVFFNSNTVAQDSWTQGANMRTARATHTVGTVNGKIYVIGSAFENFTSVEEYNPETNRWTTKADMPTGRGDFSGCAVNGKVYAIGGWLNNSTFSIVEEYDPATDTWTTKSSMPTARWGHATCMVNGKVYVIGGSKGWPNPINYETTVVYDPITDTWTTKASTIPTPRWMLSCCVVNGKIYAIGGFDDYGAVSTVELYNPATDSWITKSSMPTARWGLATSVINGKIYAIGGSDYYLPQTAFETVEEYDPITDTWTTKTPMPKGRIGIAACSVNGKIYLPGGTSVNYEDIRTETYIYDPGNTTSLENNIIKPVNSHLLQNYPNPFKLLTTIKYSLPKSDFVIFKIYNLLDQEVEILVNTFQTAGDHQITWEAEGFRSGIYFYRLQTSDFTETKKLILQKLITLVIVNLDILTYLSLNCYIITLFLNLPFVISNW